MNYKYLIENSMIFVTSGLSFRKYFSSFKTFELAIIALAFTLLQSSTIDKAILNATIFSFVFTNPQSILSWITNLFNMEFDIHSELNYFHSNLRSKFRIIFYKVIFSLFIVTMQFTVHKKLRLNTRRKVFHFLAFFIFYNKEDLMIRIFLYINYFFIVLNSYEGLCRRLFNNFLSSKDYGRGIFSHIYLISACVYSSYFCDIENYNLVISSICIMDSFASIAGQLRGANKKSISGFVCGQMSVYIVEYILSKKISFFYHFVMGLIEMYLPLNDNITLPFFGCCFLNSNYSI